MSDDGRGLEWLDDESDEEADESDGDMGFALFDDETPPKQGKLTHEEEPSNEEKPSDGPLLVRIVDRQAFDGSWPSYTSIPCKEMGLKPDDVQKLIETIASTAKQDAEQNSIKALVTTVLVVRYMEKKMADEEETWELVVEKARMFIEEMESELGKDVVAECWKLAEDLTSS